MAKKKSKEVHKKEFTDPLSLEEVDHLGPAAIKVLKEHGIFTTFQLKHKNPTWVKTLTGYGKVECEAIFKQITERLISAKLIKPQQQSGSEVLQDREVIQRIESGCKAIDNLLNGGIECGSITEFYGENGAGKTQLSHNFAIQVQRPISEGGLYDPAYPDKQPIVYFLATENTFRPERIISIAAGKGLITDFPRELKTKVMEGKELKAEEQKEYESIKAKQKEESGKFLDNIIHSRVTDAQAQCKEIEDLIANAGTLPIRLIIVDSGTALFRAQFLGLGNMKSKFDLMNEMVNNLLRIAEMNKIAVIFVNQIYHDPDAKMGADDDIPYGGNIIGHAIPYRVKIEKSGRRKKMTMVKSPHQANNFIKFDITGAGPVDIQDE